jgi:hypothetical protein
MTQPKVTLVEQDGALGVLPSSAGALLAVIGVATAGALNTPSTYGRAKDLIAAFSTAGVNPGPAVEAAAHYIERYGRPVVFTRVAGSVAGTMGVIDVTGMTGTSVATIAASPVPNDDADVWVKFPTGGTIGVTGIVYQVSLDGGVNYGPKTALGTASNLTVPAIGTLQFNFAAGTIVANSILKARANAPTWNSADIGAGLDALTVWIGTWEILHVVGPLDATLFDALELKIQAMAALGKDHPWIGSFRMPSAAESEAAYKTAFDTAFATKSTTYGVVCSGAIDQISSVSGRKYRRPWAFTYAAREASVSHEVNTADVNLGALPGDIRDANGNVKHHDESANPGLDDSRSCVARTWDDFPGLFVNRPRLLSSDTSDFDILPKRRVMNEGKKALRAYLQRRLNKPIRVDKTTGFILEEDAAEIEAGANAVLRDTLLQKPKASDAFFVLSRTDNVLSTKTLTGECRIVPLAYPEQVNVDPIAFFNPALQIAAAA